MAVPLKNNPHRSESKALSITGRTSPGQLFVLADSLRKKNELSTALRLVDRGRRVMSEHNSAAITPLLAELLIKTGQPEAALALLQQTTNTTPGTLVETSIVNALLSLGRFWAASERLESILGKYCVDDDSGIASCARSVLDKVSGHGWFGIAPNLDLVGEVIQTEDNDGRTLELDVRDATGASMARSSIQPSKTGNTEFRLKKLLVQVKGSLHVFVDGMPLLGSGAAYPPDFGLDGRLESKNGVLSGWVCKDWAPLQATQLKIEDEYGTTVLISTGQVATSGSGLTFKQNLRKASIHGKRISVSALLPDGTFELLPDSPFLLDQKKAVSSKQLKKIQPVARTSLIPAKRTVVIIPVYVGKAETLACIRSVTETLPKWASVLVVDDASPDRELSDALDNLASKGQIELLRNEKNLGFPATVNRALGTIAHHDVLLLNSDTVVFTDWLARLRKAAYSAVDIGTVTPFTNKGTIASYPSVSRVECTESEASDRDNFARKINRNITIDIPVAVGFCMYVRRDCLSQIGNFDSLTFGKGYGEETDFCLRAALEGWRHVLAADVYVLHAEGMSFGKRRRALQHRSAVLMQQRYPNYENQLKAFAQLDPIQIFRRRFDEKALTDSAKPFVLIITLDLSGGVDRFMAEHCDLIRKRGARPLILMPLAAPKTGIRIWAGDSRLQDLDYKIPQDLASLAGLLKRLKIEQVELHHFMGIDASVVELVRDLGVPYDVYIHDYIWICPRIRLLGDKNKYCGEPAVSFCKGCVKRNGSELQESISVQQLRARSGRWIEQARDVVVPANDVADRLKRYFPAARWLVRNWETPPQTIKPPASEASPVRVALIGGIGVHKGYNVLLKCARDAAERKLPLEFVVIGFTEDDERLAKTGKVFVTGRYWESEVASLLYRERPHVAFFASIWPETWCYTLTHAVRGGLPIVAFDVGAVAERLRKLGVGTLVALDMTPKALNDQFMQVASRKADLPIFANDTEQYSNELDSILMSTKQKAVGEASVSAMGASVNSIALPQGLYYFSVAPGMPASQRAPGQFPLPALQVSVAPGVAPGAIEFMSGPQTHGTWFYESGNALVARVTAPSVSLILTSIRGSSGSELKLNIERLDSRLANASADLNPQTLAVTESKPSKASLEARNDVPLELSAHIRGRGDTKFVDGEWAGRLGKGMWIEAFSVTPLQELTADDLEYKGLTASGFETPWLSGGAVCGTRGLGVPLIGFAIRLKTSERTKHYTCEYSGYFGSGTTAGPFRNGTPCRSTVSNDSIEGLQILILKRQPDAGKALETVSKVNATPAKTRITSIGPSFSKFREELPAEVPAASKAAAKKTAKQIAVGATVGKGTSAKKLQVLKKAHSIMDSAKSTSPTSKKVSTPLVKLPPKLKGSLDKKIRRG